LREVEYHETTDNKKIKFHRLVTDLYQKEKIICPISNAHIVEIDKIGNYEKRENTITIMNKMSNNICFQYFFDCITEEIISYLIFYWLNSPRYDREIFCLDNVSRIFGTPHMEYPGLSSDQINNLQKYSYDLMSCLDLENIVGFSAGSDIHSDDEKWEALVVQHNFYKAKNTYKDFKDALFNEINGFISVCDSFIVDAYKFASNSNEILVKSEIETIKKSIYSYYHEDEANAAKLLPTIYVISCLNAYFMVRKEETFKKNDIVDIWHACISIPYSDYVFTERKLANIVNFSNQLKIREYYDSRIVHELDECINELEMIN